MKLGNMLCCVVLAGGSASAADPLANSGGSSVIALRSETRVSANCGFGASAITYRIVRGLQGAERLEVLTIESIDPTTGASTELEVPELPAAITEIERPDVQRVVPSCIDDNARSYIFYVGSETSRDPSHFGNVGDMQTLYFNIYDDDRVVSHALPYETPVFRR